MIALGFLAGLWTATRRARRVNVHAEIISDITFCLMLGAIIGARAVHVLTYWQAEFAGKPVVEIFAIWNGGLVFYGGLVGATITGTAYLLWKKLPVWKMIDVLAPSIPLGSVFGRIGCLLNGCCFGRICDLPWAIHYPSGHETHGAGVHPAQIYDALSNLLLYLGLAWLFRRRKIDGQIFALYLIGYAVARSISELFRGDYASAEYTAGLTPAQLTSAPVFITGIVLWLWLARRARAKTGLKPGD